MKNFPLLCMAGMLLFTASCKKGDNHKLDPDEQVPVDYMSTQPGSWWLYASNEDDVVYRRMATGKDSLKDGLLYNYYESYDTVYDRTTPEYFGKNGDKFLMLVDLFDDQQQYVTVVLSKDNPVVGDNWINTESFTFSGIPLDAKFECEVVATNLSMTINGKTYNNIVQLKNDLKARPSITPLYANCGTVMIWYSKGTGIIKRNFDIDILSLYKRQYTDSLIDYHLE
jgi:hypothetical protein